MSNSRVPIASYTGRIKVGARKSLALAMLLGKSAPADITPAQRAKLTALMQSAEGVDSVQADRDRVSAASIQPLRTELARGWSAFELSLEAASNVPVSISSQSERAANIRATLLPEGREFTKLSAVEAWTHSRRLLGRIETDGLTAEINEICGAKYLQAAKFVTEQLGEALGLGESTRKVPSATAIADAMDKFTTALAGYTRSLAADVDEDDAESCRRFFDAVGPIDEYRSTSSGDSDDGSDDLGPVINDPNLPSPSPFITP